MLAVVGRSYDTRSIAEYLKSVGSQPSALLIDGEPGIGRSTLWLAGLNQARERGFQTLSARVSKAEVDLEYATVADLLAEVDLEVLQRLPDAHVAAIDRVLLRGTSDATAEERHVVAAAVTSVIQRLCRDAPVIVGIDDVQWLDRCSRAVLGYVARRLGRQAALLVTERQEAGHPSATSWLELASPDAIHRLRIGPMCMKELHELLSARFGRPFPRPTMRQIVEISAGNPFYALELGRAVAQGSTGGEPDFPQVLADLVRVRVADLSPDTRQVLLAAACVENPTVEALARATGTSVERTLKLLDDAERHNVVAIHGNRVHYCHPLLARGVYTTTAPAQRREMHGTLANVVTRPELRARHMALAALSADPDVLRALDDAANAARARGAPAKAAELLDLAIKLGGDTPLRRTRSAENHLRSGDSVRAGDLLAPAIEQMQPGPQRAFALSLLAGTRVFHNSVGEAADLLKRAAADAEGNPVMVLQTLLALAFAHSIAGDYDEALQIAKRAVAVALRNRIRRQKLPPEIAQDVLPKNILMIGSTGVGKTEIARRLARLANSPFIKIEASKFTEVGYVGRDVESMIRELADVAVDMAKQTAFESVLPRAEQNVEEKLLDLLLPPSNLGFQPSSTDTTHGAPTNSPPSPAAHPECAVPAIG